MKSFVASILLFASSISSGAPITFAGSCLDFASNAEVARCAEKMPGHGHAGKLAVGRKMTKAASPQPPSPLPLPAVEPVSSDEAQSSTWFGTEAERDRVVESLVNRHGH